LVVRFREGPLAQLVERHVYTVDVIGSSPVGPTRTAWSRFGGSKSQKRGTNHEALT
jgi:hypothetical protein